MLVKNDLCGFYGFKKLQSSCMLFFTRGEFVKSSYTKCNMGTNFKLCDSYVFNSICQEFSLFFVLLGGQERSLTFALPGIWRNPTDIPSSIAPVLQSFKSPFPHALLSAIGQFIPNCQRVLRQNIYITQVNYQKNDSCKRGNYTTSKKNWWRDIELSKTRLSGHLTYWCGVLFLTEVCSFFFIFHGQLSYWFLIL